jgi:rare lipoprotein A
MKRVLAAAIATALLLTFAKLSPSFGAAPEASSAGAQTGIAACYNRRLSGHRNTSGQRYNPNALTSGHSTIPIGTKVKVTNIENGRSVVLTVNDHMSAHHIIMDISKRACHELKFPRSGEAKVNVEVLGSNSSAESH